MLLFTYLCGNNLSCYNFMTNVSLRMAYNTFCRVCLIESKEFTGTHTCTSYMKKLKMVSLFFIFIFFNVPFLHYRILVWLSFFFQHFKCTIAFWSMIPKKTSYLQGSLSCDEFHSLFCLLEFVFVSDLYQFNCDIIDPFGFCPNWDLLRILDVLTN